MLSHDVTRNNVQAHTNWTVDVGVALRSILSLAAAVVAPWRAEAWRDTHQGSPGWLPRDSGCGSGASGEDGEFGATGESGESGERRVGDSGGGDGRFTGSNRWGGDGSDGGISLGSRGGAIFSLTRCSSARPWAPRCREVVPSPPPSAVAAASLWAGPVGWAPCRRLSDYCEAWRWCVRDAAEVTEESTRRDWRENCWQPATGGG